MEKALKKRQPGIVFAPAFAVFPCKTHLLKEIMSSSVEED
jgi:hypothetical protein